jgi:hypothetical protein
MFHGKFMTITELQQVAETQTITIDVNVVDINVTTRSKAIEQQLFKDRKQGKQQVLLTRRKKNN